MVEVNQFSKNSHAYLNYSGNVSSGVDNFSFNVDDSSFMLVDAIITVHNNDFTNNSPDTRIVNIIGNLIEVEDDLGFTPSLNDSVELIGFLDEGSPYRII
jgi:hypothetical protein